MKPADDYFGCNEIYFPFIHTEELLHMDRQSYVPTRDKVTKTTSILNTPMYDAPKGPPRTSTNPFKK